MSFVWNMPQLLARFPIYRDLVLWKSGVINWKFIQGTRQIDSQRPESPDSFNSIGDWSSGRPALLQQALDFLIDQCCFVWQFPEVLLMECPVSCQNEGRGYPTVLKSDKVCRVP
jgi:hypothetical protein